MTQPKSAADGCFSPARRNRCDWDDAEYVPRVLVGLLAAQSLSIPGLSEETQRMLMCTVAECVGGDE